MPSFYFDHKRSRVDWRFERIRTCQQYRTPTLGRSLSKRSKPTHSTHRYLLHPRFLSGECKNPCSYFLIFACQEIIQNPGRITSWTGVRQDSGDPFLFALRVKETYEKLGINYREKLIVFSDSLDIEKAINIQEKCNQLGFKKGIFIFDTE